MAIFVLRATVIAILTMGLLATIATAAAEDELSNCKDAYLETSTGNFWLAHTLARPEMEPLREQIGPEGMSWSEGMEFLANALCDTPENHVHVSVHFSLTLLVPIHRSAADCANVEPNVVASQEEPLPILVCNFLLPLFRDDGLFQEALQRDPSLTVDFAQLAPAK